MMKSEFINLTGFEPTTEEYAEIEAEYMGAPEYVDKTTFCKAWKKSGGAQRLMRIRAQRIEELEQELVAAKNERMTMCNSWSAGVEKIAALWEELDVERARAENLENEIAALREELDIERAHAANLENENAELVTLNILISAAYR